MTGRITHDREGNHYLLDGKEVPKDDFFAAFKPITAEGRAGDSLQGWKRPLASEALAVHPSQIEEAMKDAAAKGVQTDFTPEGSPLFRDRDHRRRYMKAYAVYDRDAGYSDSQIGSTRGRDLPPEELDLSHLNEAAGPTGVEVRSGGPRFFRAS